MSTSQDTDESLDTFIAGGRTSERSNTNSPSLERTDSPIFPRQAHRERAKTFVSRGLQQAKGLARSTSHTLRRLPARSSPDTAARTDDDDDDEKSRLEVEANTNLLQLIGRWKDPKDRLRPSAAWKRAHPRMNYHLQEITERPRLRNWRSARSARLRLVEAKESYIEAKCPEEEMYWAHPYWQAVHLDRLARRYLDYLPMEGPQNAYA